MGSENDIFFYVRSSYGMGVSKMYFFYMGMFPKCHFLDGGLKNTTFWYQGVLKMSFIV